MPSIVTVNVSLQLAPSPSTLQKTGAFISQGGTTKAQNSLTLLTQLSDLTGILKAPAALSSLTWSANVVTATTAAPHGYTTGDVITMTIGGATPAGYNGTFQATITGASTFTYPLAVNPGTETVPGTYVLGAVSELLSMGTTFFAQGSAQSVYVLELGEGTANEGVATLTTWLTNHPLTLYGVLVPREWDANANFLALIASYESTTSKFYFWVTTTTGTYTSYTAQMKDVIAMVEAPGIPPTEFSLAAAFWVSLNYSPSSTNKVTPFAFSQLFGVTPYPTVGNNTLLTQLKTAGVNVVMTGAEGGLTGTYLYWGTTMDVNDFTFWYSIDWMQINCALALANTVINGSNNPLNPLDYDQNGIDRLQASLASVGADAIAFALATGKLTQTEFDGTTLAQQLDANAFTNQMVINAVPFVIYATQNPGDYKIGKYAGLSMIFIVARGFIQIVLNIIATDFITF